MPHNIARRGTHGDPHHNRHGDQDHNLNPKARRNNLQHRHLIWGELGHPVHNWGGDAKADHKKNTQNRLICGTAHAMIHRDTGPYKQGRMPHHWHDHTVLGMIICGRGFRP